jgi:2-dehydropantoate 2-reductase
MQIDPHASTKIVFLGIGAIGGSAGAWVSAVHPNTFLLARGETAAALRSGGLTLYTAHAPEKKGHVSIRGIARLNEVPDADVVIIGVKLYQLEDAARQVRDALGDLPLVVGLQNGVAGQQILPRYFSRVVYGIACYNAWVDAPGVIGYQTRGPLILGTPDNSLKEEMRGLVDIFNPAMSTSITDRLADAAHSKLIINLGNSVTTLLGLNYRPIDNLDRFQKILSGTMAEGVRIIRTAGYHEVRLGDIPPWAAIQALKTLPTWLTRGFFRRNLSQMTISSMGQDVLQRKKTDTELEYLNGYLLSLADRTHTSAPYNRAIYRLCKEQFARPGFQPLSTREVWEEIKR